MGYKDSWERKEGDSWVRCESPTKNYRHLRLFAEWIRGIELNLPSPVSEYIFPVVLFIRCSWLKSENCSMPVFRGSSDLVGYIRRLSKGNTVFSPAHIEMLPVLLPMQSRCVRNLK